MHPRTERISGHHLVVSYASFTWSKGAAWDHLQANPPKGLGEPPHRNPWRKSHFYTEGAWVWYRPVSFTQAAAWYKEQP
jgi:hypothetical protein